MVQQRSKVINPLSLGFSRKKYWINAWKNKWFYIFALPAVVVLFLFAYKPMYGVIIAFKDFKIRKGIWGSEWIGMANFKRMFTYANFWQLMRNTIYISLLKIFIDTFSTIILALLFNELRNAKFKRVVQSFSYLPHFISWVILGGIIRELFSPTRGVVNDLIKLFGGKPIYFLADANYFVGMLIVTNLWKGIGWGTIIYLAAISAIDQEQYESAVIDGASRFQQARYITIPCIMPTIVTLFILNLGSVMNAGFDQIFNLYNSQVYSVADIIDTYVYRIGLMDWQYSYSTAVNLFKNVIGIILVIGSNRLVRILSKGEQGLW